MAIDEQRAADGRKPRGGEIVAARVRELGESCAAPAVEGVMPLNPGFFELERMRSGQGAKLREAKPTKARG